MIRRLFD